MLSIHSMTTSSTLFFVSRSVVWSRETPDRPGEIGVIGVVKDSKYYEETGTLGAGKISLHHATLWCSTFPAQTPGGHLPDPAYDRRNQPQHSCEQRNYLEAQGDRCIAKQSLIAELSAFLGVLAVVPFLHRSL